MNSYLAKEKNRESEISDFQYGVENLLQNGHVKQAIYWIEASHKVGTNWSGSSQIPYVLVSYAVY